VIIGAIALITMGVGFLQISIRSLDRKFNCVKAISSST
jgi:hypothetical protein